MDRSDYDRVIELIEDLWPKARLSDGRLEAMYFRFKGFSMVETLDAFRNHCRDNPDSTSPTWSIVITAIGRGSGDTKDDFQTMLNQIRRHSTEPGSAEWSDERAWAHHLAMLTYAYRQVSVTKQPREDADGSLARMAFNVRKREAETWRSHFEYAHKEPPAFLLAGRRLEQTA